MVVNGKRSIEKKEHNEASTGNGLKVWKSEGHYNKGMT